MKDVPQVPALIDAYVAAIDSTGAIRSDAVRQAFRRVRRHEFVRRVYRGGEDDVVRIDLANLDHLRMIYADNPLVTRWGPPPSSTTLPSLMAAMLERLDLRSGMRVLEIGAGTGYNAALMSEMVGKSGRVVAVDILADVAQEAAQSLASAGYDRVEVLAGDGFEGAPEYAPYDRIIATTSCSSISPHWCAQLAPSGTMLIPLAHGSPFYCPLTRIWQEDSCIRGAIVGQAGFMAVTGSLRSDLWLTEEQHHGMHVHMENAQSEVVGPGFDDLGSPSGLLHYRPEEPSKLDHFLFFLALHSNIIFVAADGFGFGDDSGIAFVDGSGVRLYGVRPDSAYHRLMELHAAWHRLEQPRMQDFRIEFEPRTGEAPSRPASPRSWTVERPFYRQHLYLG